MKSSLAVPFFITLCGVIAAGFWFQRRFQKISSQKADQLLMARKLSLPAFVGTLVVSWYGGISGVTSLSFEYGIYNFVTQGVFWYATYLAFAFFILPKLSRDHASTLPELIGNRFGQKSRKFAAILSFFSVLPFAYASALGIILGYVVDWPLWVSIPVSTLILLAYSLVGGIRTILAVEFFQFLLMTVSVFGVVILAYLEWGPPQAAQLPALHYQWDGGRPWSEILVWGFIALGTWVDPLFYQRSFTVANTRTAQRGIIWATLIWFLFDIATTLSGLYARAYFESAGAQFAYFHLAEHVLPVALAGVFFAGLASAAMAALDSGLFSGASLIANDLISGPFQTKNLKRGLIGSALVVMGVSPFFDGNIAEIWKFFGSLGSACLLVPWGAALMMPKMTSQRFFFTMAASAIGFITGWVLKHFGIIGFEPFYGGIFFGVIALGFFWIRAK